MRINTRVAMGLGAALLAASTPLLGAMASAATNPPWEPDANAVGTLTFYGATGKVVTGGSNDTHLFAYAAASSADATHGTKATLVFANPTPPASTPTGNFPTGQGSASTSFPNASAPAPLATDAKPVVTVGAGGNLANFVASQTVNTAAGYASVYQIRVVTSGVGGVGTAGAGTYWDADVKVNSNGSWVETYPVAGAAAVTTTTKLAAHPGKTARQRKSVKLTAKVAAKNGKHPAGSVRFFQDGTNLGKAKVVGGVATLKTKALLPSAPHRTRLTATFTPTDESTYGPSTSRKVKYTVNPIAVKPKISGPHQVGKTEKCKERGLDFGVKAKYTWLVNGKKVHTGKRYKVAKSAQNNHLACRVAVHDGSGPSSKATSKSVTVS